MVKTGKRSWIAVLALAALVLTAIAVLRGAEYDEQYTMFLTGGVARPVWPETPFAAGDVRTLQAGHAGLAAIARDLRATDVHPPLYFWAVALWRRVFGGGLLIARLFSVLCGVAALAVVAVLARQAVVPPVPAMLLTLGCYGFAYTGAIARGFALAQALTLCSVALLLSARRHRASAFGAGLLLGAATFANYLAVFVGAAAVVVTAARATGTLRVSPQPQESRDPAPDAARSFKRQTRCFIGPLARAFAASAGMAPFLLADLWFFVAQRNSRIGQFPPFHLRDALQRLMQYAAANLFGGLPLYIGSNARPVVAAAIALVALACVLLIAVRWRRVSQPGSRSLLAAAMVAPPIGLVVLGVVFHNTPIELRYLAFAAPFAALLLAGALASLPTRPGQVALALLLIVQATALVGLATRQETMQPAGATAAAAARLAEDGPLGGSSGSVVLLPHGNEGVGIVGAFAIESPPQQRLLVVDQEEQGAAIIGRLGPVRRVVLALMAQDDASRATIPTMRAAFASPCWRQSADGFNVLAFDRICEGDVAWHSSTVSH